MITQKATTDTTPLDLDAIRARYAAFDASWDHEYCAPDGPRNAARSADDVPKLLAEIDRLRADLEFARSAANPNNR